MNHILKIFSVLQAVGGVFYYVGTRLKVPYARRKHIWELLGCAIFIYQALRQLTTSHSLTQSRKNIDASALNVIELQVAWLLYSNAYQHLTYDVDYTVGTHIKYHIMIGIFAVFRHMLMVKRGMQLLLMYNTVSAFRHTRKLKYNIE